MSKPGGALSFQHMNIHRCQVVAMGCLGVLAKTALDQESVELVSLGGRKLRLRALH